MRQITGFLLLLALACAGTAPVVAAAPPVYTLAKPSTTHVLSKTYPATNLRLSLTVRFSKPGVVMDSIGIERAPKGASALQIMPDGEVVFRVYDAAGKSDGRDPSGWHLVRSGTRVQPNTPVAIDVDITKTAITLYLNGRQERKLAYAAVLSGQPMYLGNYPHDDKWAGKYLVHAAMIGTVTVRYVGDRAKAPAIASPPKAPSEGALVGAIPVAVSATEQVIAVDKNLSVTVPGGVLTAPERLVVKRLTAAPTLPSPNMTVHVLYDVTLGTRHEFAAPLTFSMAYDPALVPAGCAPEQVYQPVYWAEDAQAWVFLPCRFDATTKRVLFQTRHLSPYGLLRRGVMQFIYDMVQTEHFHISYSKAEIQGDPDINDAAWLTKLRNERRSDPIDGTRLPHTAGVPYYIEYAAAALEYAYARYKTAGYHVPTWFRTPVHIGSMDMPNRDNLLGVITLTRLTAFPPEMRMTAAHEFFHTVEAQYYVTPLAFLYRTWWLEACAEFAAHQEVLDGKSRITTMPDRYLNRSILLADGEHDYATAHFLKYLHGRGQRFHGLFDALYTGTAQLQPMEALSAPNYAIAQGVNLLGFNGDEPLYKYGRMITLGTLERTTANAGQPLPALYRDFAAYVCFHTDSPIGVKDGEELIARMGTDPRPFAGKDSEVKHTITVSGEYCAVLWPVRVEMPAGETSRDVFVQAPDTLPVGLSLNVYVLKGNARANRELAPVGVMEAGNATREVAAHVASGDALYVLAVNTGPKQASVPVLVRSGILVTITPNGLPNGEVGVSYPFTATVKNLPAQVGALTYQWWIGDGTGFRKQSYEAGDSRRMQTVLPHVFAKTGIFSIRVALMAKERGQDIVLATSPTITVVTKPGKPGVSFAQAGYNAGVGQAVEIAATARNAPANATYLWVFSDGSAPQRTAVPKVSHRFTQEKTVTVTVTLCDAKGAKLSTAQTTVRVTKQVETAIKRTYYRDGKLCQEYAYRKGTDPDDPENRQGAYKEYYPNGQLAIDGHYTRGMKTELWTNYYDNGQKAGQVRYNDDSIPEGPFTTWYKNGRVEMQGTYNPEGKLTGAYATFFENGNKREAGTKKDGVFDGPITVWYSSGRKEWDGAYRNGKRHGVFHHYFNNTANVLRVEVEYRDDAVVPGTGKAWDADGKAGAYPNDAAGVPWED